MSDPFDLLDIAPAFALDDKVLADRHRQISRALHPDRFVGRPATERREALGRAIEVNEAYRALKHPLSRAEALLKRLNLERAEGEGPKPSPEFLMEIMEQRESLREAAVHKDVPRIENMEEAVRARARQIEGDVADELERAVKGEKVDVDSLHSSIATLRYYYRFLDEAEGHLDELI